MTERTVTLCSKPCTRHFVQTTLHTLYGKDNAHNTLLTINRTSQTKSDILLKAPQSFLTCIDQIESDTLPDDTQRWLGHKFSGTHTHIRYCAECDTNVTPMSKPVCPMSNVYRKNTSRMHWQCHCTPRSLYFGQDLMEGSLLTACCCCCTSCCCCCTSCGQQLTNCSSAQNC